ncbi:MAG: hypothetical protein ACTSV2_11615 [Candidatus Thorarchaeota archaeon]
MDEETKYRVESDDDEETEKKGFFRPLPEAETETRGKGKTGAMTTFLGISMLEKNRDLIILILIPAIVGLIDANIYSLVMMHKLTDSTIFLFVLPALAAIPIGLTAGQTSHALISGMITAVFFMVFFMLFVISPSFIAPENVIGDFFVSGIVVTSVYFLFVILASLLGALLGALVREFL